MNRDQSTEPGDRTSIPQGDRARITQAAKKFERDGLRSDYDTLVEMLTDPPSTRGRKVKTEAKE